MDVFPALSMGLDSRTGAYECFQDFRRERAMTCPGTATEIDAISEPSYNIVYQTLGSTVRRKAQIFSKVADFCDRRASAFNGPAAISSASPRYCTCFASCGQLASVENSWQTYRMLEREAPLESITHSCLNVFMPRKYN